MSVAISSPAIHQVALIRAASESDQHTAHVALDLGVDEIGLPIVVRLFVSRHVGDRGAYAAALAQAINQATEQFERRSALSLVAAE
jgi:hypothetical protein